MNSLPRTVRARLHEHGLSGIIVRMSIAAFGGGNRENRLIQSIPRRSGGERGIRTPGTDNRTTDFETLQGARAQTLQFVKRNVIKPAALAASMNCSASKPQSAPLTAQIRHNFICTL